MRKGRMRTGESPMGGLAPGPKNFEKKFQKPIDKPTTPCYNKYINRARKELIL